MKEVYPYKQQQLYILHTIKKAYKELKEIEESHRKENGELREKVKQLEEENTQLKTITQEYNSYLQELLNENHIPHIDQG